MGGKPMNTEMYEKIVTDRLVFGVPANKIADDYDAMVAFKDEIDKIPAADVRPMVRGRWVAVASARGGHECSVCHQYAPSFQNGVEHITNYCPNCGAMMDGN